MPKTEKQETTSKKKASSSKIGPVDIQFALRNETKGAVRFVELNADNEPIEKVDDEDGAIGSLYVRKQFLDNLGIKTVPEGCTVTIQFR